MLFLNIELEKTKCIFLLGGFCLHNPPEQVQPHVRCLAHNSTTVFQIDRKEKLPQSSARET